ncbi:transposase [Microvirga lupini]|uniref:Transposase n=1 Tax=Microvirga lupini TaxID=420324 RepID=A0A7W4VQX3_9HYPH|nr:helix-turn-helix domain-containing protein [Microvirga lupini]MBB3021689.1 transposase [Microvirga lupini]
MRAVKLTLTEKERNLLLSIFQRSNPAERKALRAGIVLRSAAGLTDNEVACEFQVSVHTVSKWRRRYHEAGLEGLTDWPRSGKPRRLQHDTIAAHMSEVMETMPPDGGRWSVRKVATALGLPPATTGRIWRNLQSQHAAPAGMYQSIPANPR